MNQQRFVHLTQEYENATEKRDIRRLIIVNRELYKETFGIYDELVQLKRKGLNHQGLNNDLDKIMEVLEVLKKDGMKLSIFYPEIFQEINLEELN
jgi:hypothetical protein